MAVDLVGLVEKAKGLFRKTERATDVVVQDRWDVELFNEIREEVPRIDNLVQELQEHHDYAEDLVRDMAMLFFQAAPEVRTKQQIDPSRLLNHAVLTSVEAAPETLETRQYTRHDKYGAALGVLSVAQKIRDLLDQPPQDEAQEAGDNASDAENLLSEAMEGMGGATGDAEGAQQALEEAAAGFGEVMGDYEGEGPLTEAQAAAQASLEAAQAQAEAMAKALEDAIAAAEEAQAAADQAIADAEHKADVARDNLDILIRQGLSEATQQLQDEMALFSAWGSGPGALHNKSYAERERLTEALRRNRLSPYVDTLGRFRMTANATQAKKTEYGMDEFYSTELSGDLDRILDGELAMLAIADGVDEGLDMLQDQAMIDLVEEELISRKFRGEEKVGKGAIVCLVDTSQSMTIKDRMGIPREVWAKAFALALLEVAQQSKRDFVGILFSDEGSQKVFHFPKGEGTIEDRLAFADKFYDGGTHFEAPIDTAMDILEKEFSAEGKSKGDLILITDDDYRLTNPAWLEKYQERKKQLAFRLFGIAVGMTAPGSALVALSKGGGNVRAVTEFTDPQTVVDIMQTT
jgi:uncharacterized protein with von Willebrand factor type A (vWA) domain